MGTRHLLSHFLCSSAPQLSQCWSRDAALNAPFRGATPGLCSLPPARGLCSARPTSSAQRSEGDEFGRPRHMNRSGGHLFNNQAKSSVHPSVADSRHSGCLSIRAPFSSETNLSLWGLGKDQDPDAHDKTKETDRYSVLLTSSLFGKEDTSTSI